MKLRDELSDLGCDLRRDVETVIETVRLSGQRHETDNNGTAIYAYRHPAGGIAWGVDSGETGMNIARGIEK